MSNEKKEQPKEPKLVENQNFPKKEGLYWMKSTLVADAPFDAIALIKGKGGFFNLYAWKADGSSSQRLVTDISNIVFGPEIKPPR